MTTTEDSKIVNFQLGMDFDILGQDFTGVVTEKDGLWQLMAYTRHVDLMEFLRCYCNEKGVHPIDLPPELAGVRLEVEKLLFCLDSKGKVRFAGEVKLESQKDQALGGDLSEFGPADKLTLQLDFTIADKTFSSASIKLHGETGTELLSGIKCKSFDLIFKYATGNGDGKWSLAGHITAKLFDLPEIDLSVGYAKAGDKETFELSTNLSRDRGAVQRGEFAKIEGVTAADTAGIFDELIAKGYIAEQEPGADVYLLTANFHSFDQAFRLSLDKQYQAYEKAIRKVLQKTKPLIEIPDVASIDVKGITLSLEKGGTAGNRWGFSSVCDLKIFDRIQLGKTLINIENGTLTLAVDTGKDEVAFTFTADEAVMRSPRIPYILVEHAKPVKKALGFDITFGSITIGKAEDWYFESDVGFRIEGMPPPLDQVIPDGDRSGKFSIEKKKDGKWKVYAGLEGQLAQVPIPDIAQLINAHSQENVASLLPEIGHGIVGLSGIGINLNDGLSLDLTMGIGLPSRLNELIGLKPHQIIRTYNDQEGEAKKKNSIIKATLSIGTEKISGRIENSPFQDITGIDTETTKGWVGLDFDLIFKENDLGMIWFQKPELAFDLQNGSFKAAGGYEIDKTRKIKIPLAPLGKVLELLHLGDVAALLPAGIPIKTVRLFDDDEKLDLNKALRTIFDGMGIQPPAAFWGIVDEIAGVADSLPDRFKDYLSINIPESLTFAVEVTADSSVSFDLAVEGDPLQLLLPMLPDPSLLGIRLYRVSFGSAFANSLLKLEVSAELDTFDLPTLAGAVLFPLITEEHIAKLLPESAKLQRSFIARNLVILIVYETGVPIPIPLFYDRLEIASFGIDGFEVRDVVSFPKPAFNLMELVQRLGELSRFFTTPYKKEMEDGKAVETGLLPIAHYGEELGEVPEEGSQMDIAFAFGPLYLRLPKYLGYNERDYYELTGEDYKALLKKDLIADDSMLKGLKRQRFLTKGGFERAVDNLIGEKTPDAVDAIIDACRHLPRPMGQLIGTVKHLRISGWDLLYLIMNSVKKGSVNYPIQYFHINDRIGDFKLKLFNLFEMYVTWALTTPYEFNRVAYPKLVESYAALAEQFKKDNDKELPIPVKQSPSDELIRLIAQNDTGDRVVADTEGVVIFMRGGLLITNQVIFETAFGLMAEGVRGFRTGISFLGHVANLIDCRLLGFVKISPKSEEKIKLLGKSALSVFDREVVSGLFELTDKRLFIDGRLDLFPQDFPLVLKGHVYADICKSRFLLDVGLQFAIGQLRALARIYMHAEDKVKADVIQFVKDEFQAQIKDDINALFLKLRFINATLALSVIGQTDHESEASVDAAFQLLAVNLIDFKGALNITVNRQAGFAMQGKSSLVVGPPTRALVRGEAFLDVALDPHKGSFGIQTDVQLFLGFLSSKVGLSGGLAFFTWFSGDHAGDFLLSLGGYHPLFKRPAHYPPVSRIGLNLQLDSHLNIKGSAYFTLTSACIMGGGKLEATWQSGGLRAAFVADANFIVAWRPFQYHMNLSVNMRLSYTYQFFGTHTLSGELGADLSLWGPELSGSATVHIWRISFPIRFGAGKYKKPEPVGWARFRSEFLPAGTDDDLCRIVPAEGVARDLTREDHHDIDWVFSPGRFKLSVLSVIPVKASSFGSAAAVDHKSTVGIGPMGLTDKEFHSAQTIRISRGAAGEDAEKDFHLEPIRGNSPKAIWGESLTPQLNDDALVRNTVTGFDIVPINLPDPGATAAVPVDRLRDTGPTHENAFAWETDVVRARRDEDTPDMAIVTRSFSATTAVRSAIMAAFGLKDETDLAPNSLTTDEGPAMICPPQIWRTDP